MAKQQRGAFPPYLSDWGEEEERTTHTGRRRRKRRERVRERERESEKERERDKERSSDWCRALGQRDRERESERTQMHRTRTGESYVPVGRDDAPSSETERRGGTARYMYEVTGRALDSLQAAASEEWTTGRVTSREELEASTAAMFNRLVRAAFKTCCPDYRLTHVKATASVVYAEIERSGAPNEEEIPMGGLTARLVTKDEPDSACCVPRGVERAQRRVLSSSLVRVVAHRSADMEGGQRSRRGGGGKA